jgi:phosphate-selective porin OprO/OprP
MQYRKLSALAGAAAILVLAVSVPESANAADQERLDILLANGAITQQHDDSLAKEGLTRADVEGVAVSLDQGGLNVRSADGEFAIKVGARLHADFAVHNGDRDTGRAAVDGTELRRARIELSGTMYRDWRWAAETDLADNDVSVKDFWLSYTGFDKFDLTVGHQKQPYSLAIEMS